MSIPQDSGLTLIRPCRAWLRRISDYRAAFSPDRARVTYIPERVPGLDHLEEFESAGEWLKYAARMKGRISWYMAVRLSDLRVVGFVCLRHDLRYDDDDIAFASHIGGSVRPDERGRGYGKAQLRLALREAARRGIGTARLVCVSTNVRSRRAIEACGGRYVDSIYGEESGLTVLRYDVDTSGAPARTEGGD